MSMNMCNEHKSNLRMLKSDFGVILKAYNAYANENITIRIPRENVGLTRSLSRKIG